MYLLTMLTPYLERRERLHGQGGITYDQANVTLPENISPQAAPDPIRQGDTPARPSRRNVAAMSLNLNTWGYGIKADFIPTGAHALTRRLQPAGRQLAARAQNSTGVRPNVVRPPAVAYGSLFGLGPQVYDLGGN